MAVNCAAHSAVTETVMAKFNSKKIIFSCEEAAQVLSSILKIDKEIWYFICLTFSSFHWACCLLTNCYPTYTFIKLIYFLPGAEPRLTSPGPGGSGGPGASRSRGPSPGAGRSAAAAGTSQSTHVQTQNRFCPRGEGPGDEVTAQTSRPHIGARHRLCHCAKLGVCIM